MLLRLVIFLALNFGGLAIGGFGTSGAVVGDWYQGLQKAPWTPPGWVFGAAWTMIMICFSIFLAWVYPYVSNTKHLIILFAIQWILNVSWNFVFFNYHYVFLGVVVLLVLFVVVALIFSKGWPVSKLISLLVLPYLIWLCIATSLNVYVLFNN